MGKKRLVVIILVFILVGFVALWALDYFAVTKKNVPLKSAGINEISIADQMDPAPYKIEEVVRELFVPWSIVFTSDERILVTERDGKIRVIENGELLDSPLITLKEVASNEEAGLMGMAVDPNYEGNKYLYVCYAYENNGAMKDKVVRLVDKGSSAEVGLVLIDNIPAAKFHAGCRLKFGPDGMLYITTGDATNKDLAQDVNSLAGKILRINKDGTVPVDNPFENSLVFSFGHRNSQGISWDSNGTMYSTEHGPSVFDGPAGGDEINIIKPGFNYGWPVVSHEKSAPGMEDPKLVFTPAVAPASALLYSGKMFPQFKNSLFFGGLRGEGVYIVVFSGEEALGFEKLEDINFGRIRDVVEAPNGEIWFTTSNRDGRGDLNEGDDKIFRITAK